jgi:hypothetical protein
MLEKISPEVDRVIKPIIAELTEIDMTQKMNPMITPNNESQEIKRKKRRCVHITWNGSDFIPRVVKKDGVLKCAVCGQEIGTEFTEDAVEDYFRCLKRVNQLLFFGMLQGMLAGPIQGCITLKEVLPDAAKLHKELNMYVGRENRSADSIENIGDEYRTSNDDRNLTGFHG